jgi:hypothetical protein
MSSDEDESDNEHHENDVFIFQSTEETVIFIRKNPRSVEQIVYKNNVMHESYLSNEMFHEHVRHYIGNTHFQEIEPLSKIGRIWLRRLYAKFNARMDKTMANIILNFLNTCGVEPENDFPERDRIHCVVL